MHIAKRIAFRLAAIDPTLLSEESKAALDGVLVSPFDVKVLERPWGSPIRNRQYGEGRFAFDTMVTLPSWYERLGEVFAIGTEDICNACEHWICDQWNITHKDIANDQTRQLYVADRNYMDTSNRDGSEAKVDRLATYIEFHSMMCVAAELIKEHPIIVRYNDDDDGDPWTDWLSRWDIQDNRWYSDTRQSVPLDPQFWRVDRSEWKSAPRTSHTDQCVGLTSPQFQDSIVVDASWNIYVSSDHEHVYINSALVSAETAQSLLFALEGCASAWDYRIPSEDDELEIAIGVGNVSFDLRGWIRTAYPDSAQVEEHDPLRYEFLHTRIEPGREFTEWAGLQVNDSSTSTFHPSAPDVAVTRLQEWNDCTPSRHNYGTRSHGVRLWMQKKTLLKFLSETRQCLILKCGIDRYLTDHEETQYDKQRISRTSLYLVHASGEVETVDGRYRIGEASS